MTQVHPDLEAKPDPEYRNRILGDQLTAEFAVRSTRSIQGGQLPIEKAPLFAGGHPLLNQQPSLF